ncbi:UNVERIFIED_CONTAM: hypothetical protein PYX00_009667 [Menopon gallinae]|uniref:Uncharacterized protein n=1 Tax=Menopon gallinae TaxID=328185 RepID=A0AAW2HCY8_9NEOP
MVSERGRRCGKWLELVKRWRFLWSGKPEAGYLDLSGSICSTGPERGSKTAPDWSVVVSPENRRLSREVSGVFDQRWTRPRHLQGNTLQTWLMVSGLDRARSEVLARDISGALDQSGQDREISGSRTQPGLWPVVRSEKLVPRYLYISSGVITSWTRDDRRRGGLDASLEEFCPRHLRRHISADLTGQWVVGSCGPAVVRSLDESYSDKSRERVEPRKASVQKTGGSPRDLWSLGPEVDKTEISPDEHLRHC